MADAEQIVEEMFMTLSAMGCKPRVSGDQYIARCPAHNGDDYDSLTFKSSGDKVLTKCHSKNCSHGSIMSALNLSTKEENGDKSFNENDFIRYVYVNAEGNPVHSKLRGIHKKKFFQNKIGEDGEWKSGAVPKEKRVPYRLPSVIEAVRQGQRVFIVEGEKDVETLETYGFVATTFEGGSNAWLDHYKKWFRNGQIVIIPDADAPGQKFCKQVQQGLRGIAKSCDIIDLGYDIEDSHGKDISDWFAEGNSPEDLKRMVTESWKIAGVTTLAEQTMRVSKEDDPPFETFGMAYMGGDYPIPGICPASFFVIAARLNTGKTTYMIDLLARMILHGKRVYVSTMDEPARRLVRYLAASITGNFLYNVSRPDWYMYRRNPLEVKELLTENVILDGVRRTPQQIAEQVAKLNPDILMVDHLAKTKSGERNSERTSRIEEACQVFDDVKESTNCAIIAASQANRGSGYKDSLIDSDSLYGSDSIGHTADMVITLQAPGGADCDPVISKEAAEKVSQIDIMEHYRILHTIKNRFGPTGVPTWHNMCGAEKRFFALHEPDCNCMSCNNHRETVKLRAEAMKIVSGEMPF